MSRSEPRRSVRGWPKERVLPTGPLRGQVLIAEAAWTQAAALLRTYRGRRGDHEGIVFLLGVRPSPQTLVITTAVAPEADHGPEYVMCNEEQMLAITLAGRAHHIALLGQLHSHPNGWTEHSPGDDQLVFMPRELMISIVAPHYGHTGLTPIATLGVHQFQDGRWVLIDPESVSEDMTVLPAAIDLR